MKIAMTVSDRPHYLVDTLESWTKVRGLDRVEEFVFMVEPTNRAMSQLHLIHQFRDEVRFRTNVRIVVNSRILGVMENPYQAFETCFKRGADYVILAEEDLIVSDDVIEYHDWARIKYRHDPEIGTICSFTDFEGDPAMVERVDNFGVWIWGTWRDRWDRYFRDTWDHNYSTYNVNPGHESGWDWNINTRIMPAHNLKCIVPTASRSQNIGQYGVHASGAGDFVTSSGFQEHRPPVDYTESHPVE